MGMNPISLFEAKVANGNGEQTLSRDVYRLGRRFDFYRMLSFYFTTVGFYFSSMVIKLIFSSSFMFYHIVSYGNFHVIINDLIMLLLLSGCTNYYYELWHSFLRDLVVMSGNLNPQLASDS